MIRAARVGIPPERAFDVFTREIGAWWPLPSHSVFGERAGGLVFRDGLLTEIATDGAECSWGEVRSWDPPRGFVISWHPGRGPDEASEVAVAFEPDGDGTRVVVEHRGWESFGADALRRRRGYVGPGAWGHVLDHFADAAEPRLDAVDREGLAKAYEQFFDEAQAGEFGTPPAGEWNADQVLAHVALSDLAVIAVSQALINDKPTHFENQTCQTPDHLAAWITRCRNRIGLIAAGRETAAQLMSIVGRLSPDQLATEVPCHLTHDGQVVVDAPRPWGAMAVEGQARIHLPAHIEQLQKLRDS